LSPSTIEIIKNGSDIELLSSKRLNQEEIDKILGINYHVFKQVVCLAINNNSSFLSQTASQKRNIIESIFDIKIFGEMLSKLKSINKNLKMEGQVISRTLEIQETALKSLMKQIKNIIETKETFDTDKQRDIDRIESDISIHKENIIVLSKQLEDNKEKLKEIQETLSQEDLTKKPTMRFVQRVQLS
jgi:DNA repair exonuclease SbcCD ATPase subunit